MQLAIEVPTSFTLREMEIKQQRVLFSTYYIVKDSKVS